MRGNFALALAAVLRHEGGYVNAATIRDAIGRALALESEKYAARPISTANHRAYECSVSGCERLAYAGGYCNAATCRGAFPLPVYDFHHVGEKADAPSHILDNGSVEKMALELSRCLLLCANCHRMEHNDAG